MLNENKKKKIFFIFHGRFPSEKAASLFAVKNCEALANSGFEVILLVPKRLKRLKDNIYKYYNTKNNFSVVFLPTIDLFFIPIIKRFAFLISLIFFSLSCYAYLLLRANKEDIIYSNESLPILLASLNFKNTLYEVHDFPEKKRFFYKVLFKRAKFILATNRWKKDQLGKIFNVYDKIIFEPNSVEIRNFNIEITKIEARKLLKLPFDKNIIVYTGHLYSWKGVDVLAESAKYLSEEELIIFIGGTEKDIKEFKNKYGAIKNIKIIGHRPHTEIPLWQKSADILVLPNTSKEKISKFYTSPMKLFEYMSSGTPIVASKIPSITEILNNKNSVLTEPDNPKDMSDKIMKLINNRKLANDISTQALKDVQKYSWDKRANRIKNILIQ